MTFLNAFLAGTSASPACLHLSHLGGHMGEQSASSVLFDTSTLQELFAQCEELQARSLRLFAEARLMTARLRELTDESARLVVAFPGEARLARLRKDGTPAGWGGSWWSARQKHTTE